MVTNCILTPAPAFQLLPTQSVPTHAQLEERGWAETKFGYVDNAICFFTYDVVPHCGVLFTLIKLFYESNLCSLLLTSRNVSIVFAVHGVPQYCFHPPMRTQTRPWKQQFASAFLSLRHILISAHLIVT